MDEDDLFDSFDSRLEDMYLAKLTDYLLFDKRMKLIQYEMPDKVYRSRKVDPDLWKNIPFAVTESFQSLEQCQSNISKIFNLVINDSKNRCQVT